MLTTLKKKSIKVSLRNSAIIMIIIIGYAIYSDFGSYKLITGPIPLESLSSEDFNKQYVETEMYASLGSCMELYSTNKKTKDETLTHIYYVVPVLENKFMAISIPASDVELADQIVDDTYDWLMEDIDYLDKTMAIKGTVYKMSSEEQGFFEEFMQYTGYTPEEIEEYALPYILKQDHVGKFSADIITVSLIVSVLLLLYIIYSLIRAFTGSYQRNINKYLKENSSFHIEHLDADFSQGISFGSSIIIGRQWTFYLDGAKSFVVENKEIAWAYHRVNKRYGKGYSVNHYIILHTINQKQISISIASENLAHQVLQYYGDKYPHIVTGYSDDLLKCFNKDIDSFLKLSQVTQENNIIDNSEHKETDSYEYVKTGNYEYEENNSNDK